MFATGAATGTAVAASGGTPGVVNAATYPADSNVEQNRPMPGQPGQAPSAYEAPALSASAQPQDTYPPPANQQTTQNVAWDSEKYSTGPESTYS